MTCFRIGYGRGPLGIEPATWAALARFFAVVFAMALMQLWTDSRARPECEIQDTLFMIIPNLPRWMGIPLLTHAADVWVILTLVALALFIRFNFFTGERQLYVRRWFSIWTYGYFFRFATVGLTHYVAPIRKGVDAYTPANPFLGALLITFGIQTSLNDLMFSGHTLTWVLAARYVWHYSKSDMFRQFFAVWCAAGPVLLLAVREHVGADVGVALIIGGLLFSWYHLWYVRNFRQSWLRLWELRVDQPMRVVYPLRMTDAEGNEWTIGENREGQVELVGAGVTPEREAYMQLIRWFDDGQRASPPPPHPMMRTVRSIGV